MRKSSFFFIGLISCVFMGSVNNALWADEIKYDAGKRRNPFIPFQVGDTSVAVMPTSGFRLQGIIYDSQKGSLAILNGKMYKVNENIGEAVVKKIQKNCVVIELNGEEKTLWVREEEKRVPYENNRRNS